MPWEIHKVEVQRKYLIEAYLSKEASMTELCNKYKISRKTGYKWVRRYQKKQSIWSLQDRSKAPINPKIIFDEACINIAIDMKLKHRTWGPRKILAKLRREYPKQNWPSATRLYEIFRNLHLVTLRRLRKKVPATHPLGELNASNDVWIVDFKGWFMTENKQKCEPLTMTDGYSRFLLKCEHVPKKSVEYIWPIYKEALLEYGLPKRIRTDNGSPFGSVGVGRLTKLSVNLIKAGVTPEWINPGHPEENGRHERFHLTLKQDIASPPAKTLPEQIRRMRDFQDEYNFDRPHESLNQETPASQYGKSPRIWDGVLRDPEYDTTEIIVRKVMNGGGISIKGQEYFISKALTGEYVGIKEENSELKIYFGPVSLGKLELGKGLVRPVLKRKPIVKRG